LSALLLWINCVKIQRFFRNWMGDIKVDDRDEVGDNASRVGKCG